ncbi:hypothetical protein EUGRSUZ_F01884 [Eucalyptus grandis]|uniref:Uncharacterized protein n=2 Tax=Eucalyptus grandis TaxID=71139 RepID=A0ACC3KGT9_EUCGR|nr:hypothetical protein EUGRSUZ_F01884 [Eucalyptus grandis]
MPYVFKGTSHHNAKTPSSDQLSRLPLPATTTLQTGKSCVLQAKQEANNALLNMVCLQLHAAHSMHSNIQILGQSGSPNPAGLTEPLNLVYADKLWGSIHGDVGSVTTGTKEVNELILRRPKQHHWSSFFVLINIVHYLSSTQDPYLSCLSSSYSL